MPKPKISAKELIADIQAGLDDQALMKKYGLSAQGLQSVFKKLVEAKALKQSNWITGRSLLRRPSASSGNARPAANPRQENSMSAPNAESSCPNLKMRVPRLRLMAKIYIKTKSGGRLHSSMHIAEK